MKVLLIPALLLALAVVEGEIDSGIKRFQQSICQWPCGKATILVAPDIRSTVAASIAHGK